MQVWKTEEDRAKAASDNWGRPGTMSLDEADIFRLSVRLLVYHRLVANVYRVYVVRIDPSRLYSLARFDTDSKKKLTTYVYSPY